MESSFRPGAIPTRIHFGSMVNLDDAFIGAGEKEGFGFHPHKNMEIISLILKGTMDHKDHGGNNQMIKSPAVQGITSGTGIVHNEVNGDDIVLNMMQIWFLPNENGIPPNYAVLEFTEESCQNGFREIVSPNPSNDQISISQNVRMSIGEFDTDSIINYAMNGANKGAYIIVLEGSITVGEVELEKRDAIGVTETESVTINTTENQTMVLIIEVDV